MIKPAEDACLTSLRLVELSVEAGIPTGAINLVPGRGKAAGAAIPVVVNAIAQNSGQTCSAGARVLVEQRFADTFVEHLKEEFSKLEAGTSDQDRHLGPVINLSQKKRVDR